MSAMEKMVASMLGISGDELGAMLGNFQSMIVTLNLQLGDINAKLDLLLAEKGITYERSNDGNGNGNNGNGNG